MLLRWGAMDAESYPEDSKNIIEILWKIGTSSDKNHGPLWLKARVSAFNSLVHYEVFSSLSSNCHHCLHGKSMNFAY